MAASQLFAQPNQALTATGTDQIVTVTPLTDQVQ